MPVPAPRCLATDLEDVLEHLDTLQVTTVEPAEPALFLEGNDHGLDPLRLVIGRNEPPHLSWYNRAGEALIEAFLGITVVTDCTWDLGQSRASNAMSCR